MGTAGLFVQTMKKYQIKPNKPKSWITVIDANGLYASGLTENLCVGNYMWAPDEMLAHFQENKEIAIMQLDKNDSTGYLLSVNCYIPEEFHEELNSYPPAVTRRKIIISELSDEQMEVKRLLQMSDNSISSEKLIAGLNPKLDYVTYYFRLQTYIKRGLRISSVNKIILFDQAPYMAPFINHVALLRQNATDKYTSQTIKALGNCLFGKFMENVRNRQIIKVV